MNANDLVSIIALARADYSGYSRRVRAGLPPPVSQRLFNPGLITQWSPRRGQDDYPVVCGFTQFPSHGEGWRACVYQTRNRIVNKRFTLFSFFHERERAAKEMIDTLCRRLRTSASTPLANLITEETNAHRPGRVQAHATGRY